MTERAQIFTAARQQQAHAAQVADALAYLDEVTLELLRVRQLTDSQRYRLAALLTAARVKLSPQGG